MTILKTVIAASLFAFVQLPALAADTDFSGRWGIDLRTPKERQQQRDCGGAAFVLKQAGDRIVGNHTFATVGCGRINEGGDETVKGIVMGATAVLVVTSGRNGAVVFGKATRQGDRLQWSTVDEVAPGQPEDDALILQKGTLLLEKERRAHGE